MASQRDRCAGALIGLAAGDRNGGPVEMALALSASLLSLERFEPVEAGRAYLEWWAAKGPAVWDTGPTAEKVFELAAGDPATLPVAAADEDRRRNGMTAGANVCHRVAPLAMLLSLTEDAVAEAAKADAALTHGSALAGAASAAVVLICRRLIMRDDLPSAVAFAAGHPCLADDSASQVKDVLQAAPAERNSIVDDGFCVNALAAALHFAWRATDFEGALCASIRFAGFANYSPVICGTFLGAMFGATRISPNMFAATNSHPPSEYENLQSKVAVAARALSRPWPSDRDGPRYVDVAVTEMPEALLSFTMSFLHALHLTGPAAAVSHAFGDACVHDRLVEHVFERDLACEDAHDLPRQPLRPQRYRGEALPPLQLLPSDLREARNEDAGEFSALGRVRAVGENLRGRGALHAAHVSARDGRPMLLCWAAFRGASLDNVDGQGRSALMIAAMNNRPKTVAAAGPLCDIEQTRGPYGTALHMAAFVGAAQSLSELSGLGADLGAVNGTFGQIALHVACSRNHGEAVRTLLAARSDADVRDRDGLTARQIAGGAAAFELEWMSRARSLRPAPGLEVPPPSVMKQQQKPFGGEKDSCCFVIEHMASSLRALDTSIVKKCNLEVGNFNITLAAKRATMKKGGSSFRASKGKCTAQVKCNSETKREFTLALRLGNAPALVTVRHDFSKYQVCTVPGVVDLNNALDENASLFRLAFEFTVV